jgi:hypothetical protein
MNTNLRGGEIIVAFQVPAGPWPRRSLYSKDSRSHVLRFRVGIGGGCAALMRALLEAAAMEVQA